MKTLIKSCRSSFLKRSIFCSYTAGGLSRHLLPHTISIWLNLWCGKVIRRAEPFPCFFSDTVKNGPGEGFGSGFLLSGSWSTRRGSCLTGCQRSFKFFQLYNRYWCRGGEYHHDLLVQQLICLIRLQDTFFFGRKAFHFFLMAVHLKG